MIKNLVVVGLSGGVDSAVSAYLLKQQGYQVIALYMQNWDPAANQENLLDEATVCAAEKEYQDAKEVADKLGIPIYRTEFIKEYWDNVFTYFLNEYRSGSTPNPDILCNKFIKFDAFMEYAIKQFDCEYIAMGHYANVTHDHQQHLLLKAKDENKDQTYFLCDLSQKQLSRVLFPLGNYTKDQVREIARKNNISIWNKKDSTGICFIGKRDFRSFLNSYIPKTPGDVVDITNDKIIGHHEGCVYYTIGQRKGLNLGGNNEKYFVCSKNVKKHILYVAPISLEQKYLYSSTCILEDFNWITPPTALKLQVRFRHRQKLIDCKYKIDNKLVYLTYDQKARAVTSGQFAVLYEGNKCLGGGRIKSVNLD